MNSNRRIARLLLLALMTIGLGACRFCDWDCGGGRGHGHGGGHYHSYRHCR